jgi:hypothetical protein
VHPRCKAFVETTGSNWNRLINEIRKQTTRGRTLLPLTWSRENGEGTEKVTLAWHRQDRLRAKKKETRARPTEARGLALVPLFFLSFCAPHVPMSAPGHERATARRRPPFRPGGLHLPGLEQPACTTGLHAALPWPGSVWRFSLHTGSAREQGAKKHEQERTHARSISKYSIPSFINFRAEKKK